MLAGKKAALAKLHRTLELLKLTTAYAHWEKAFKLTVDKFKQRSLVNQGTSMVSSVYLALSLAERGAHWGVLLAKPTFGLLFRVAPPSDNSHSAYCTYTLHLLPLGSSNKSLFWQSWIPGTEKKKKKCARGLNGWRCGAYKDPRPQARRHQQSCSVLLYRTQSKINAAVLCSADCQLSELPAPRSLLLQARVAEATSVTNRSNGRGQRRGRVLWG